MSVVYLKRLREFASIDLIPYIIRVIESMYRNNDTINVDEKIAEFNNAINSNGLGLSQDELEAYHGLKNASFIVRCTLSLIEISAYYDSENIINCLKDRPTLKEDRIGIGEIFNLLRTLPDYYYNPLIKSIENSIYYQDDLIDCIVQDNKKEFVEIIRRERYDINELSNICSSYKLMTYGFNLIQSEEPYDFTEESTKKLISKNAIYFKDVVSDEAVQQLLNYQLDFLFEIKDELILQYWQEKDRYTTTERKIIDSIMDDVKTTPDYILLYNKYHKDGVFYPNGVNNIIEDAEVVTIDEPEIEAATTSLPEAPAEPIIISQKYEGGGELYCNNKNRDGGATLTLDEYFTTKYKQLMILLKDLAESGYIRSEEINSYFTHFSGMGSNHIALQKLHWEGTFCELCFLIYFLYPYKCDDVVRYEPIKKHIKYKHEDRSYKNGTDYSSAASRPGAKFKTFIKKMYKDKESKPENYKKILIRQTV